MKNKYLIIYFLIGVFFTFIGALFKITHMEVGVITGNLLLTIGLLTKAFVTIIFIIKILSDKDNKFLNK